MQSNRWLQTLIVLLTVIATLFLLSQVWSFLVQFTNVILLFFMSWLLAFVLRPIARWLTAHGLPYTISVIIVYLALALVFTIGGYLLVPVITQQVNDLSRNYTNYLNELDKMVRDGQKLIVSWGIRPVDIDAFLAQLRGQAQSIGMGVLNNTLSLMQGVANIALQVILTLLLSFYFMKDGERIFGNILQLLPPRWQDEAVLIAASIEKSFGGFVRGQVVFALIYSLLTAGVMLFFKLDYVVIASLVAGLCMIIPLIGNFLAFAPPMLVCLVQRPSDWLWVLATLFIFQSIQMNFVGPRIMSQAIGIHPLYVVASMLVGGQVAGFWGALFGIPIAGAINLIGRPMMRRIRYQVPLYHEVEGVQLTTRHFTTGSLRAAMVERTETTKTAGDPEATFGPPSPPPGAASPATSTTTTTTTSSSTLSEAAPSPASTIPHPTAPIQDWEEEEETSVRSPSLTGRMLALLMDMLARAYNWAGERAHARSSRQ